MNEEQIDRESYYLALSLCVCLSLLKNVLVDYWAPWPRVDQVQLDGNLSDRLDWCRIDVHQCGVCCNVASRAAGRPSSILYVPVKIIDWLVPTKNKEDQQNTLNRNSTTGQMVNWCAVSVRIVVASSRPSGRSRTMNTTGTPCDTLVRIRGDTHWHTHTLTFFFPKNSFFHFYLHFDNHSSSVRERVFLPSEQ